MFRPNVSASEEWVDDCQISADADAHDKNNADVEVAVKEEAFDFACSNSKCPLLLFGIVNDEQRQG